ncbi:hypothetical protein [Fusobacterium sp. PH5-44]|uniref:hypothetical protein n=1 Tax=unclassified Fusobacterium TaxID=2648384 RepID=UPI003D1EA05A
MKKMLGACFMLSFMVLSASEVVPSMDKEVVGVNKEQLDARNVDQSDIQVDKSAVNSSSSERFVNQGNTSSNKIKVIQTEKSDLEREVSSKSEKSGGNALKWVIGVLGVAALIIAL